MKYPLNFENSFDKTFIFWLSKFLKYKLSSLSNRLVNDKDRFYIILQSITKVSSLDELSSLVKEARNLGLSGINTYYKPLEILYKTIKPLEFAKMQELDEEVIIDFLASATSKLSDATKKNYKNAIINFFKYIDKQNEDDNNKSYHFDIELKNWGGLRAGNANKLPEFLNKNEIEKFIKAIDTYEFSQKVAYRNRLLLKLILFTGIRVGESLAIKLKDIYDEEDVYIIKIVGKGNKSRSVMIRKAHIQTYLIQHLSDNLCQNELLFCNKNGNALTQSYISRMVEKVLISCGLRKEKNGAHMLRHSYATLLYQKSKDLILVQEALGHASLNTSRIYTHFDKDKLYKATQIMDEF